MNTKHLLCATAFSAGALLVTHHAAAAPQSEYLQAVSDLKAAQWDLSHRAGGDAVSHDEKVALTEVERAIDEARVAAIEDIGHADFSPPEQMPPRADRLEQAAALLDRARAHLQEEEDKGRTRQLLKRIEMHLDHGQHAVELAIEDARREASSARIRKEVP